MQSAKTKFKDRLRGTVLAVATLFLVFFFFRFALASTNIVSPAVSTTSHWAWNDVIGWIDFYGSVGAPLSVNVSSSGMTGYASSSAGWISLDCTTGNVCNGGSTSYNVTNDGSGALGGWAWNDSIGWISFCGRPTGGTNCQTTPNSTYEVTIDSNGNFSGYAWNDAVGWISFNCSDIPGLCSTFPYKVATTWTATSTSGYLDSSTFDTGISGGVQINSIVWHGSMPSPTNGAFVGFQFAVSSTSTGPWNYLGPDNTSTTYYGGPTVGSGTSIPVSYTLFNNQRYFRYRITLSSTQTQSFSPRVDDVSVNWSR